jgi:hypothetical protein
MPPHPKLQVEEERMRNLRRIAVWGVLGAQLTLSGWAQQPAATDALPAANAKRDQLNILFTGYLLGYYRQPEVQLDDFSPDCPESASDQTPTAVLQQRIGRERDQDSAHTILVGMGENFAVELGSRTYQPAGGDRRPKTRDPENEPSWQKAASGKIGDAIGCFLARAGYDAVVPGQNDFYFGPERLRRIAQRLAGNNEARHPVHMLASNLIVKTVYWEKQEKIPDSVRQLDFSKWPDSIESPDLKDHAVVLPFLRQLRFTVKPPEDDERNKAEKKVKTRQPVVFNPEICGAAVGRPDQIDGACSRLTVITRPARADTGDFVYGLATLRLSPGANYGLCFSSASNPAAGKRTCMRFSVAEPFWRAPAGAPYSYDLPYIYLPDKNVVIFGVLDPDINTFIGRDNLSWINRDNRKDLSTETGVLDPYTSLVQAMQLFRERQADAAPGVRKVLLAEMSRARAEELASHLGFDVVITKALPYGYSTPNQTATLHGDQLDAASERESPFHSLVVSPWMGYESREATKGAVDPLRKLALSAEPVFPADEPDCTTAAPCRHYVLSGSHQLIDKTPPPATEFYTKEATDYLSHHYAGIHSLNSGAADEEKQAPLIKATLAIIREAANADAAILQKRDFYWGPFLKHSVDGEGVERILWKGDGLRILTVKGKEMKKALDESDAFDDQDDAHIKESQTRRRGLVTIGISKSKDGDYLVAGSVVDDDRLYTIATSDHIAAGDTGYPELDDTDLNQPSSAENLRDSEGVRISYLVCENLGLKQCLRAPGCNGTDEACAVKAKLDFPNASGTPVEFEPTSGMKWRKWARGWQPPEIDLRPVESKLLTRPGWRFSVLELSSDLGLNHNNLTEPQRIARLQGVSEPGTGTQTGHSVNFALRSEWVRTAKHVDEYIRGQIEYQTDVTDRTVTVPVSNVQVLGPPSIDRKKNRMVFDAGFFVHRNPGHKDVPKVGFVLQPFRFDSPLRPAEVSIDPHFDAGGTLDRRAFVLELARTRRFLARAGLRAEGKSSHIEIGYEAGVERNALASVVFNSGSCDLSATQLLKTCLDAQGAALDPNSIQQVRRTRKRSGLYADAHWEFQFPVLNGWFKKWKVAFDDQGEYFAPAHGDNSTDTLYRNDATWGVSMPILPSVKLVPGFEVFLYENKIGNTHLARTSPTLKLVFSFDRYSGGSWWKSIRYKPDSGGGD